MCPKKVILCVDDNEQELSVLKFMLATNGYKVIAACSGQEAIGIFAGSQVDLVLADYAMPLMNGNQLVGRSKQIAPHIPMILLGDPKNGRRDSFRRCIAGQEKLLRSGAAGAHQNHERSQAGTAKGFTADCSRDGVRGGILKPAVNDQWSVPQPIPV